MNVFAVETAATEVQISFYRRKVLALEGQNRSLYVREEVDAVGEQQHAKLFRAWRARWVKYNTFDAEFVAIVPPSGSYTDDK